MTVKNVFNLDSFKEASSKEIKLVKKAFKRQFVLNQPPIPTLWASATDKPSTNMRNSNKYS